MLVLVGRGGFQCYDYPLDEMTGHSLSGFCFKSRFYAVWFHVSSASYQLSLLTLNAKRRWLFPKISDVFTLTSRSRAVNFSKTLRIQIVC
jgi:hypothetical protein